MLANIVTPEFKERGFFSGMFGWTTRTSGIGMAGSSRLTAASRGMWDMASPNASRHQHAIGVHVQVENDDAAAEKVGHSAGRHSANGRHDEGRMVPQRSDGALFDFGRERSPGMTRLVQTRYRPSLAEHLSTDVEKTREFYTGWLGGSPQTGHGAHYVHDINLVMTCGADQ